MAPTIRTTPKDVEAAIGPEYILHHSAKTMYVCLYSAGTLFGILWAWSSSACISVFSLIWQR